MKLGFGFNFKNNGLYINLDKTFFGHGFLKDDLIVLNIDSTYKSSFNITLQSFSLKDSFNLVKQHARLRHITQDKMSKLTTNGLFGPFTKIKVFNM